MKKVLLPGLLAGLAMTAASLLFSLLVNILFPKLMLEYQNPGLFRPWSDPIMSLYFVYPFLLGLILAWAWDKANPVVAGKGPWQKGLNFGLAIWLIASVPGMFISYSSFPVSLAMISSWTLNGLLLSVVAGWTYAKLNA